MPGRFAAQLQLASGSSVRMIGGFAGTDPDPVLEAFQDLVASGRVHYLVVQTGDLHAASGTTAGQITAWLLGAFPEQQHQGWLVFDLSAPSAAAGI